MRNVHTRVPGRPGAGSRAQRRSPPAAAYAHSSTHGGGACCAAVSAVGPAQSISEPPTPPPAPTEVMRTVRATLVPNGPTTARSTPAGTGSLSLSLSLALYLNPSLSGSLSPSLSLSLPLSLVLDDRPAGPHHCRHGRGGTPPTPHPPASGFTAGRLGTGINTPGSVRRQDCRQKPQQRRPVFSLSSVRRGRPWARLSCRRLGLPREMARVCVCGGGGGICLTR